jgi:hypothetical protein
MYLNANAAARITGGMRVPPVNADALDDLRTQRFGSQMHVDLQFSK